MAKSLRDRLLEALKKGDLTALELSERLRMKPNYYLLSKLEEEGLIEYDFATKKWCLIGGEKRMVDKEKKCVCVTLTKPYLDAIEGLVQRGVYVSHAEIIKDALRRLFRHYEIEPFGAEKPEEAKKEMKQIDVQV